jgi:hypothetical protein
LNEATITRLGSILECGNIFLAIGTSIRATGSCCAIPDYFRPKPPRDIGHRKSGRASMHERSSIARATEAHLETKRAFKAFRYKAKTTSEELLVGSVNTCMMLTFLALAQARGLTPVGYESEAEGLLENVEGK